MDTNYKNMAGVILLFIGLNQMFQVCQPLIRDERKVFSREKKVRHPVICSSHISLCDHYGCHHNTIFWSLSI